MAHPVLVHFNQVQSVVMSNPLGLPSVSGLYLHFDENICGCISAEISMVFDNRSMSGQCLSVSQTCRPKQLQVIH